jgi:hypothetical protein
VWPLLSGQTTVSPRAEVVIDHNFLVTNGGPAFGALRFQNYKLLVGPQRSASWYGHFSPNQTTAPDLTATACTYAKPCLFDLSVDPYEHTDISDARPDVLELLLQKWHSYDNSYHISRVQPRQDLNGYCNLLSQNNYVVAPFTNVPFPPYPNPTSLPTALPTASPTASPTGCKFIMKFITTF